MVLGLSSSTSRPSSLKMPGGQFPLNLLKPPITGLTLLRPLGTSLAFQVGAVTTGWGLAWATDRTDVADIWWALAIAENSWLHAIGLKLYEGMSFADAMGSLSYREKLLLFMTTTWSLRLTTSMVYQAYQHGEDIKYKQLRKVKTQLENKNWWIWSYANIFLTYAVQQALVCIPTTLAFYTTASHVIRTTDLPQTDRDIPASVAVFLFTVGFMLESLADVQRTSETSGVYSIVRLPGTLGDTLIHTAFYILGIQQPAFYTPGSTRPGEHARSGYHLSRIFWAALGPLANYFYLRGVERNEYRMKAGVDKGGEREVTVQDEEKVRGDLERITGKNAVWPKVKELKSGNVWLFGILGVGCLGVGVEYWLRP